MYKYIFFFRGRRNIQPYTVLTSHPLFTAQYQQHKIVVAVLRLVVFHRVPNHFTALFSVAQFTTETPLLDSYFEGSFGDSNDALRDIWKAKRRQ